MMARSHLIGGSAMAVGASSALLALVHPGPGPLSDGVAELDEVGRVLTSSPYLLSSALDALVRHAGLDAELGEPLSILWLLAGVLCFWLGCLAPDIDSSSSRLGRHIWFPGPHRGVTHSDWSLLLLVGLSLLPGMSILIWLAAGWATHLFLDGLSRAGRARLYPLQHPAWRVRVLGDQPAVVRKRWRGLYRAGHRSETVVLVFVVIVSAILGAAPWCARLLS